METIIAFVTGSSVVASLLIGLLKGWLKKVIIPRYGDLGVLVVLMVISGALALIGYGMQWIPSNILLVMGGIFSGAVTIYQALYKSIIQKAIRNKLDPNDK